jgi:peptidoglycan/LPS O-acetylase OafA/YrhL
MCEAVFYALYPFLIFAMRFVGFSVVLAVSVMASIALSSVPDDYGGQAWSYGPALTWLLFLPIWLIGVAIAEKSELAERLPRLFLGKAFAAAAALTLLVLGALAVVAHFHFDIGPKYKTSSLLFAVPAAFFIFTMLSTNLSSSSVFRFLDRQGKWSYSLYLIHPLAKLVFVYGLVWSGIEHFTLINSLGITVALILFAFLVSYLFYLIVERPAHRLAKRLASRCAGLSDWVIESYPITWMPRRLLLSPTPATDEQR